MVRLVIREHQIELVLEGLPEDEGRVRLTAFMSQLQKLNGALNKLDREAHEGRTATAFQIVDLSYTPHSNSVAIEIAAAQSGHRASSGTAPEGRHRRDCCEGEFLSKFDAELLEDIRGLAAPVGKQVKTSTLIFDGTVFDLTPRVAQQVEMLSPWKTNAKADGRCS